MQMTVAIPEGRRYFLTVLGRIEFEVDEEEYRRAFSRLFSCADQDSTLSLTFSHSIVTGTYKDPAEQEVKEDDDRT